MFVVVCTFRPGVYVGPRDTVRLLPLAALLPELLVEGLVPVIPPLEVPVVVGLVPVIPPLP
ncbi:MAG: hypothetical protein ABSH49_29215, partial [Bryobacteraceae bacterium]